MTSADPASPLRRPLVGRDREIARLAGAVEGAVGGRGHAVLLLGDAGMGKTRLLEETHALATDAGADVCWGRAWRPEDAPAFWPWVQVLRELVRSRSRTELVPSRHAAAIVGRVAPDVAEALAVEPAAHDPGPFDVLDAMAATLVHAARGRPLVVLLDDLHDADAPSLDLLALLAGQAWASSLAIVAASRPTTSTALSDVAARADVVSVRGLDAEGIRALAVAGGVEVGTDRAARLERDTRGNPFLVLESLAAGDHGDPGVGVRSLTESRLRDLPPAMVQLLTAAAVLDDQADEVLLAEMLDRDPVELLEDLKSLADLGLVARAERPTAWTVGHDLLRDALLDRCEETARRRLDEAAARALAGRHGDDPQHAAAVAHHLAAAVPLVPAHEAAAALRRAADVATGRLAHEEAARHLTTAAGLLRTVTDLEEVRLDVLLDLGRAQLRGTAPASARTTLAEATELARRVGGDARTAQAVLLSCDATRRAPGFDMDAAAVVPELDDALERLAPHDDPTALTLRAQLAATRGLHLTIAGESQDLADAAQEAVRLAEAAGDIRARALAVLFLRATLGPDDPLERRRSLTADLLDVARRTDDHELLWRAHTFELMDALVAADPVGAAAAVDACTEIAGRVREPYMDALTLVWQGTLALLQGRFDDHAAIAERAIAATQRAEGGGLEHVGGQQVYRARDLGELDVAGLDGLAEQFPTVPVIQALRVWGHLHVGNHQRADALLDDLLRAGLESFPRNNYRLPLLAMLAEVSARLERRDAAAAILRLLAPLPEQCVLGENSPVVWTGPISHFTGLLRLATGDVPGAITDLERALALEHRMGARPARARTRTALAVACAAAGRDDAVAQLRAAMDDAEALGMEWLTDEQRAVARRFDLDLGTPPPPSATTPPATRRAVFVRSNGGWQVGLGDETAHLRATKGLTYLATLLAHPRREIAALELATEAAPTDVPRGLEGTDLPVRLGGGAGPVLDDQAIAAYRRRLDELAEELEEADRRGDVERATAAGDERDALVEQLTAGVGLGGRPRHTADDAEKARLNVTRAIRTAIDRVRAEAPTLADHHDTSVQTGRSCAYVPDPTSPVTWDVRT